MIELENIGNMNEQEKILVMGVGGAGNNAINRMIDSGTTDIDFIALNTDRQALNTNSAPRKLVIGEKSTRGLGAGGNPEIGRIAAEESKDDISQAMQDVDMVFITAGMGGGTGTGAAAVVANIAKSQGILTVAVVTKPFTFEGKKRALNAQDGIDKLKEVVDTLIVIPNERILEIIEDDATQIEAFYKVDEVLRQGVISIANIIKSPSQINVDFADVTTIMKDKGYAHLGVGMGSGKNKVQDAINEAINSPLLETSIEGAKSILINIAGGPDLFLKEVDKGLSLINEMLDTSVNMIYGTSHQDELKDQAIITIIATDLRDMSDNVNTGQAMTYSTQSMQNQMPQQPLQNGFNNANQPLQSGFNNANQPLQNNFNNANQPLQNGFNNANQPLQDNFNNANRPLQNGFNNTKQNTQNAQNSMQTPRGNVELNQTKLRIPNFLQSKDNKF